MFAMCLVMELWCSSSGFAQWYARCVGWVGDDEVGVICWCSTAEVHEPCGIT